MANFSRMFGLSGLLLLGALALAGCQSGASDSGIAGVDATAPPPPDGKITQSELTAFCPTISIREGTAAYNTYAKGGDQDPTQIIYQASIADATRQCNRSDGQMAINVAIAGRVVPGPLGQAGAITMPIRVAVTVGGQVAFSELYNHQATVDGSAASQFLFKPPLITIPIPPDRGARIYVGFDEGPGKPGPSG